MLCNSPWLYWGSLLPGGGGLRLEEGAGETPPADAPACLSVCPRGMARLVTHTGSLCTGAECGQMWFLVCWCGMWDFGCRIWPKLEPSSWRTGWLVLEKVEEGKREHKDGEERWR